jgi:hypothetical protein
MCEPIIGGLEHRPNRLKLILISCERHIRIMLDYKTLFGRAPASAPSPASAEALPNGAEQNDSDDKALEIPLSRAIWWRRSLKN